MRFSIIPYRYFRFDRFCINSISAPSTFSHRKHRYNRRRRLRNPRFYHRFSNGLPLILYSFFSNPAIAVISLDTTAATYPPPSYSRPCQQHSSYPHQLLRPLRRLLCLLVGSKEVVWRLAFQLPRFRASLSLRLLLSRDLLGSNTAGRVVEQSECQKLHPIQVSRR